VTELRGLDNSTCKRILITNNYVHRACSCLQNEYSNYVHNMHTYFISDLVSNEGDLKY